MAERKSGGADLLAGLGAVGASSIMSKPKVTLPPAPPDFERLNHYYCDVLTESSFVPEEFPSSLPLGELCNDFDLAGSRTRLWKELAAYHRTSVRSLKKEYLKWRCEKDGMPYDETVLAQSIMCQNRLGDSNIQKFGSDVWAINNFMEWDEPQPQPEPEPEPPKKSPGIASMYRSFDGAYHMIETEETTADKDLKTGKDIPLWEIYMDNGSIFWILIMLCVAIPFMLAAQSGIAEILLGVFLVVPVTMFRYKAKRDVRGEDNAFLTDFGMILGFLTSTPTGLFILFMLALPIIAAIISAAWGID